MKSNFKALLFNVIVLAVVTVLLGLVLKFWYFDEISHLLPSNCTVLNCSLIEKECNCNSQRFLAPVHYCADYTCYKLTVLLEFELNSTDYFQNFSYTYSDNPQICSLNDTILQYIVKCYYDPKAILSSLTLVPSSVSPLTIVIIVLLSLTGALLLIPLLIFIFLELRDKKILENRHSEFERL